MLPPLPRCSSWAYSSLLLAQPCQPSPEGSPGRPAHRPFRGLLGVHSRCGLHTRTVTVCRDRYPKASDISSPPCLLRLLPAGAFRRVGLAPTGKRRLVTAHTPKRHSPSPARMTGPGSKRKFARSACRLLQQIGGRLWCTAPSLSRKGFQDAVAKALRGRGGASQIGASAQA